MEHEQSVKYLGTKQEKLSKNKIVVTYPTNGIPSPTIT
jgi:hypothetical protein